MKHKKLWLGVVVIVAIVLALLTHGGNKKDDNLSEVSRTSTATTQTSSKNPEDNAVATQSVTISDFDFKPGTIKIKKGDTVTWTNKDVPSHTVTADVKSSDAPNSPEIGQDETYSFTFKKVGTYTYHCSIHPHMRGTVIVE
jgi:amicyanin